MKSGVGVCFGAPKVSNAGDIRHPIFILLFLFLLLMLLHLLLLLFLHHEAVFVCLQASAPVHNTGESRGFTIRTYATSMCGADCAGMNTLMGGCSEFRVLGDNWVSWPLPGLGLFPPQGLQELVSQ